MWAELVLLALSFSLSSTLAAPSARSHERHGGIYIEQSSLLDAYDFVIVGGGLAGLVVASRLSEDANKTVLVLESGGSGDDNLDVINVPANTYYHSLVGSVNDWAYSTVSQSSLHSQSLSWPRGRLLGGSSAINGMYYVRPSQDEVNAMRDMIASSSSASDADVWGWESFYAAMKKSETFTPPIPATQQTAGIRYQSSAHGSNGPMHVTYPGYMVPIVSNWLPTLEAVGIPSASDGGNGYNIGGFIAPLSINPSNWTRSYSKSAYIDPLPPRANLHILTHATVTRLLTTSGSQGVTATGVEYSSSKGGKKYTVNVNREVVLCGGVIGSPQILQLSGIGPKDVVTQAGVASVLDLPGVGAHLQDHLSTGIYWNTNEDTQGDIFQSGSSFSHSSEFLSFVNSATAYINGSRLLGPSYDSFKSDVLSSLDDSVASSALGSDEVKEGYKAIYSMNADKMLTSDNIGLIELLLSVNIAGKVEVQVALQHPLSQGQLYITSSSVFDKPVIDPRYLSQQADVTLMREGLKLARRIGQTSPLSSILTSEQTPGPSVQSDAEWEDWLKGHVTTEYHPCGTCSMLPRAQGGVVDAKLKVYGTTNIRVADASIYPMNFASHLGAPTYGVAEIAAELIHSAYATVSPTIPSQNSSGDTSNSGSSSTASSSTTKSTGNQNNSGSGSKTISASPSSVASSVQSSSVPSAGVVKKASAAGKVTVKDGFWVIGAAVLGMLL